jgi:hypothetical protein
MKQLLIFILLFATGLAVLFKLQGGVSSVPGWSESTPEPSVETERLIALPKNPKKETVKADPAGEDDVRPTVRVEVSKKIRAEFFPPGGGKAIGEMEVRDSSTNAEGSIDLVGILVTYFNKGTLAATGGHASLVNEPGSIVPKIGWEHLELEGVTMQLKEGHPLAPMTLTGAHFKGNLPAQTFNLAGSKNQAGELSRPRVVSPRIEFEATSIHADGQVPRLQIDGDAVGIVRDELGVPLYRLSGSTIELFGVGVSIDEAIASKGNIPFTLLITGNARLAILAEQLATLSSDQLTLHGVRRPDGEFQFNGVEVDGTGVLAFGASTFTGSLFTFDFEESESSLGVGSFTVDGKPHVEFDLSQAGGGAAPLSSQPLQLDCEGPLTVAINQSSTFVTRLPTTLTWEGSRLTSQGGFIGSLSEEHDSLSLQGSAGVALDSLTEAGHLLFRTDSLSLDYSPLEDGGSTVLLASEGAATFSADGTLKNAGVSVRGKTARSLLLAVHGDRWTIPEAHDIDFVLTDKTGQLSAKASDVTGFDPMARQLDARGDVSFSFRGKGGVASGLGDVVILSGLDSLKILGAEDTSAEFKMNGAEVSAKAISRDGTILRAHENVHASLPVKDGLFRFDCETLRVSGLPESSTDDGRAPKLNRAELEKLLAKDLSFTASGGVSGEAILAGDSLALLCSSLSAEQKVSEEGMREVVFIAHTVESAVWTTLEKEWTVACGKITATSFELLPGEGDPSLPSGERSLFNLVAEGGVTVRERVTAFFGQGDVLNLERNNGDRVRLDGGPKGALVSGPFPSKSGEGNARYSGRVLWMEATDSELIAEGVNIDVTGVSFMGDGDSKPINIHCNRLEGVPGTLQLDGDVAISGSSEGAPEIQLTAEHATFTDKLIRGVADESTAIFPNVSFLAHGQVRLRQGQTFELFGVDLILEQGGRHLRVAGRPASICLLGILATSQWIEFDSHLMAFECGKGEVTMDPKLHELLKQMTKLEDAGEAKE